MRLRVITAGLATAMMAAAGIFPAQAGEQEAIDGCIDKRREVGGPDGQSGTVVSSDFSEAATIVMLKDAGGTVWKCLAYSDGTVGEMSLAEAADDGGGAMAGAETGGDTAAERVKFEPGTTGATLNGGLTPGSSIRYVLGASKEQFLNVGFDEQGDGISYQIFNPDGSVLLDMVGASQPYRGQLWQSGDHVVEVINRGNANASYIVNFNIE